MISVISLLPPKQDVLINEKHKHSFFNRTNSFKVEGNKMKTIQYAYLKGKNKCKSGSFDGLNISFYFIGDKEGALSKSQGNRLNSKRKRNIDNNNNTIYSVKERNFCFPLMKNKELNLNFNKTFEMFMKTNRFIIKNKQQRRNNDSINNSMWCIHSSESKRNNNNNINSYDSENEDIKLKKCSSLSTRVHNNNNNVNVFPFFQKNKTKLNIYNKSIIRKYISNVNTNINNNSTTNSTFLKKEETYRSNSNNIKSNISKFIFLPTVDKSLHVKTYKEKGRMYLNNLNENKTNLNNIHIHYNNIKFLKNHHSEKNHFFKAH